MAILPILVICFGIFAFFIFLLAFLLLMRYINYRENVNMAEKGISPQQKPKRNRGFLITGWIMTILGLVVFVFLWLIGFIGFMGFSDELYYPLGLGPWVLLGLIPLLFGLLLLLVYVILTPRKSKDAGAHPITIEETSPIEEPHTSDELDFLGPEEIGFQEEE